MSKSKWEWFGYPGHFICADDCRFRLFTLVGDYLISTVGDLHFEQEPNKRQTLGAGENSFFETCVFKAGPRCVAKDCDCGQPTLESASGIDGIRCATAGEAQASHMRFCMKYDSEQPPSRSEESKP